MKDRHIERDLTWKQVHYCFDPTQKIHFHFANANKVFYADLLPEVNNDAHISSIYVGTDGEIHITFYDDYKGY